LQPAGGEALPSHVPDEATVDQRKQTFLPLVVVVRRGGHVVFANNDNTMHQVYSFSAIKQFETEIDKGQRSRPIVFDKAGVAVIGCNIHDNMISYVFVADAPFAALTGSDGRISLKDLAPGSYKATIWHPRLSQPVVVDIVVGNGETEIAKDLPLAREKTASMHNMHMQSY
jgi:plastocyanin